jgi:hypothetical protein
MNSGRLFERVEITATAAVDGTSATRRPGRP